MTIDRFHGRARILQRHVPLRHGECLVLKTGSLEPIFVAERRNRRHPTFQARAPLVLCRLLKLDAGVYTCLSAKFPERRVVYTVHGRKGYHGTGSLPSSNDCEVTEKKSEDCSTTLTVTTRRLRCCCKSRDRAGSLLSNLSDRNLGSYWLYYDVV
jgi:hypothetical protein